LIVLFRLKSYIKTHRWLKILSDLNSAILVFRISIIWKILATRFLNWNREDNSQSRTVR